MSDDVFTISLVPPLEEMCALLVREWHKFLCANATPKERYFMRRAKRQRVRKKYRNRVIRRLLRECGGRHG